MHDGAGDIFHIALLRDWEAATPAGEYRVSTRGTTLDQVGFIHGSFRDQVERIGSALYATASEPVVILRIDRHRLAAPVRLENLEGGSELFPHIYGPLEIDAVVATIPAQTDGRRLVVAWDAAGERHAGRSLDFCPESGWDTAQGPDSRPRGGRR